VIQKNCCEPDYDTLKAQLEVKDRLIRQLSEQLTNINMMMSAIIDELKQMAGQAIIKSDYVVLPIESARQKSYRQEWEVRNLPGQIHLFDVQMATID